MPALKLETDRLILRGFERGDREALYLLLRDREVNTFLPWFPVESVEEAEKFYEERFAGRKYALAICRKEDGCPIGYVNADTGDGHDFGYAFRREFWRRGIAAEAGRALIERLREDGVPYITATHDRNNPGSGGVMRRLGMKYCYSYEELWQPKNILVTFRMYQLNLDGREDRVCRKYWDAYSVHFIEEDVCPGAGREKISGKQQSSVSGRAAERERIRMKKLAIFAYSRRGRETAERIRAALGGEEVRCYAPEKYAGDGFAPLTPPCARFTGPVFQWAQALIFVGSAGIAVRSIAPHVRDKRTDPAVVCADELGRFVIPLLSGHIGGANALAERLAAALDAVAVITTATDINQKFSVDAWAARQGLAITDMAAAKAVSAAILEGPVPLDCDFPISGDLPKGTAAGDAGEVGICISWRDKRPFARTLLLVPPVLRLGLGCRRGVSAEAIGEAVERVLSQHRIHPKAIKCAASIDLKRDEAGLLAYCRERGWPLSFYSAEELRAVEGEFTPSERVLRVTGVDNVCERAAMAGAQRLAVPKTAWNGVTVAVAEEYWEARFDQTGVTG